MKLTIFIVNSKSGAFYEIATGWKNAFIAAGHTAIMWGGNKDAWDRYKPDIYIGCSGWRQEIPRSTKTKIAIHTNPFCNSMIQVPGGPLINENGDAISWTLSQQPDLVFGYGLQEDINKWWHKWRERGLKAVGMPSAADITIYRRVPSTNMKFDIGWVGGHWGYKAINLDKYLVPVVRKHKLKSVWFGWSGPPGLWKGKASPSQVLNVFNSAKVCPTVVEPHTTKFGIDMPERIFKLAACGAAVVSDPVHGINRYFSSDALAMAKTPEEYMVLCEKFIAMGEAERRQHAKKLQGEVLRKHTYFHRIKTFFEALGFGSEANEVNGIIEKVALAT
jgi:hypothetical protein